MGLCSSNQCYWSVLPISWAFYKLVHESSKSTQHVASQCHDNGPLHLATSWIFQTNFKNVFTLCDFRILNFPPTRSAFFAFLLFIGSFLQYICMEASSLDVGFSFISYYNTLKLEASSPGSSGLWKLYIETSHTNKCRDGPRLDKRGNPKSW